MEDEVRQVAQEMADRFGVDVAESERKLRNLMSWFGASPREVQALAMRGEELLSNLDKQDNER